MTSTIKEVLDFVRENDIKFIRLAFCDLYGRQKNISIMPESLPRAFESGISFDACAIRGYGGARSDLFLMPDPATITILPWRPQQGRVARFLCNIHTPEGGIFPFDTRDLLRRVAERCRTQGFSCKVGVECEFYLFQLDENGDPTDIPFDRGGYFDLTPYDRGENVRREICLALEAMGISPESSHHEQGPGQNEIDFRFADALTTADDLLTFQSVVAAIAAQNGLFASFRPKPIPDRSGSGLHVNLSLSKDGRNIFGDSRALSPTGEQFMAGILRRARELSAFLCPTEESYLRLGAFEAPGFVSWSRENRSQLIRIPAASGDGVRMELRSPDPMVNPYLALALIISAGLEGVMEKVPLPPPAALSPLSGTPQEREALPASLEEALGLARNSAFARRVLGEELLARYCDQI